MGCGNFVSVFSEDPQDMPGQGLARTDNYKDHIASGQYGNLLKTYTSDANQSAVLDAEGKYKPQYITQDLANTDQALAGNLDLLNRYSGQINDVRRANDPQADALRQLLLGQATEGVQAGSGLTPEQQRAAQQASRAGMAARGMSGGNQALADELLAQFDLGEKLKGSRQDFALRTLGTNQQLQQGQTPQDWLNFATGVGRTAAPTLTPVSAQVGWLNNVYGQNQENNRTQAELETKIGMDEANKWNDWAKWATGAVACWAAREVFGAHDLRWLQFRQWLLHRAPAKLREWYLVNGEAWAARLRTNPLAKQVVKRWMERRINGH